MKKIFLTLFLGLALNAVAIASSSVTFVVRNGIDDPTLKTNIESQATKLLEMLNEAQEAGKNTLNFNGLNINDEARQTILLIWKYQHMHVWLDEGEEEAYIEETVLSMRGNQYQVRNIPMRMQTVKGEAKKEYNEVSINFDRRMSTTERCWHTGWTSCRQHTTCATCRSLRLSSARTPSS